MLTSTDEQQIQQRGSQLERVKNQIENFINGFPPLHLEKPAIPGDGVIVLDNVDKYIGSYESRLGDKSVVKFVPASGAASRMFKALFAFVDEYKGSDEQFEDFRSGKSHQDVYEFFKKINDFAFFDDLKNAFDQGSESLEEAHLKRKYVLILETLLGSKGLDYGNLPKGLLKFHRYAVDARTPAEEHLVEGANYARDKKGNVRLHFTVSPEHRSKFSEHIDTVKSKYENAHGVSFTVDYSEQKPSTDTIAVDLENEPFRNNDKGLLFRPAGHGALIENLNEIDADIIFVKNIDNIVPDHLKETTYNYKKALAGVLLETQEKVFNYLHKIENEWSPELEKEVISYANSELNFILSEEYSTLNDTDRKSSLFNKLNRPIRACGMVANTGATGGGPFWARNSDGSISPQIVETAQIDLSNSTQKEIFDKSSHFNPVDLVCGVKDYKNEKFDLTRFVDPMTGFITEKSKDGRDLKAQELPGLWNGAMADWISIMVEVPIVTFNPVKQVNDLLKPTHQPG